MSATCPPSRPNRSAGCGPSARKRRKRHDQPRVDPTSCAPPANRSPTCRPPGHDPGRARRRHRPGGAAERFTEAAEKLGYGDPLRRSRRRHRAHPGLIRNDSTILSWDLVRPLPGLGAALADAGSPSPRRDATVRAGRASMPPWPRGQPAAGQRPASRAGRRCCPGAYRRSPTSSCRTWKRGWRLSAPPGWTACADQQRSADQQAEPHRRHRHGDRDGRSRPGVRIVLLSELNPRRISLIRRSPGSRTVEQRGAPSRGRFCTRRIRSAACKPAGRTENPFPAASTASVGPTRSILPGR